MTTGYTIGQLAKEANVPTSTVRYYERRNLLRSDARSQGNYCMYDDETLERLRFIRSAKDAGFTLKNIEALLLYRDGGGNPCADVQSLISTRLEQVHEELDN
jgi:DNA-binding transcriptional MerR regulator